MRHWFQHSILAMCLFATTISTGAETASSLKVPFTIENFVDIAHPQVYVQGGIPLPRGQVQPTTPMRVESSAGPIDAEVKVSAFWPDGSVKWVLVRMQADVAPLKSTGYTLVCDDSVELPPVKLFAYEDASSIHVNTGNMHFRVSKTSANLFEKLSVGHDNTWTTLLDNKDQSSMFVDIDRRTADGESSIHFDANADTEHFVASLEEASPLVTVIRIDGIHVSESGDTFAPYTLRLYAYKGSQQIRLVHSFIYTGEPREDFIRAIGVKLNLSLDDATGYTFGTEQGLGTPTRYTTGPTLPSWRRGVLSQDNAHHFAITKVINPATNSTLDVHQGDRSQGWGRLEATSGTVSVGIKNFWQEYPKAIEIDAADHSITAYFYSPYAAGLDLRRYSDLGYHALYEAGSGKADKHASPFNHDRSNAQYISKTSELFLNFSPAGATVPPTAATALLHQRPPLLRASLEWMASTKALGNYAPLAASTHAGATTYHQQCMNLMIDEQDFRNWYSFLDYGDVMHSFNPALDKWRYDEGGYAWVNNEGQISGAYWMAYLATGDERVYRFAEAMTKHVQDVDMFQAGPLAGRGMRHNVNHWGGTNRERRLTIPFNKRIYYYLSGDEHTRDRIIFIYAHLLKSTGVSPAMDYSVAATTILFLWETTGDARYGKVLQKAAETFCSKPIKGYGYPASLTLDFKTGEGSVRDDIPMLADYFLMFFGPMRILMETQELTGSEAVKQSILNWATLLLMPEDEAKELQLSFATGVGGPNPHIQVAAYAYAHTQDPRYLAVIQAAFDNPRLQFVEGGGTGPLDPPVHQKITAPISFQTNSVSINLYNFPFGWAAMQEGAKAKTVSSKK